MKDRVDSIDPEANTPELCAMRIVNASAALACGDIDKATHNAIVQNGGKIPYTTCIVEPAHVGESLSIHAGTDGDGS